MLPETPLFFHLGFQGRLVILRLGLNLAKIRTKGNNVLDVFSTERQRRSVSDCYVGAIAMYSHVTPAVSISTRVHDPKPVTQWLLFHYGSLMHESRYVHVDGKARSEYELDLSRLLVLRTLRAAEQT